MTSQGAPIRVLIVDDHQVFAQALATTLGLQPDFQVVGTAGDAESAVKQTAVELPDVVIMDYRLPDRSGAEATREILQLRPETKVVMLTSYSEEGVLLDSLRAGVSGFLRKTKAVEDVADAVRAAHAGDARLPAATLRSVLAKLGQDRQPGTAPGEPDAQLTPRELDVLRLMALGEENEAIAAQLALSAHTIRTHVQNILGKLGVHSKLAAVATAIRRGLIEPPTYS